MGCPGNDRTLGSRVLHRHVSRSTPLRIRIQVACSRQPVELTANVHCLLGQTRQVLKFKGTKTERPRRVELPGSVLAPLEAHSRQQEKFRQQFGTDYRTDLDLIFANPDGTPLKPDSISSAVSLLCRRLGLPKGASLHTLRHTHGSFLLADGVDLATVSERLGHSSVRVTADVYSHALRGRDQDAARRWDNFMLLHGSCAENSGVN